MTRDQAFLWQAKVVSQWSQDPTTKVGAVIVDPQGTIVAMACNHFPMGIVEDNVRLNDRDLKNAIIVHAESNSILQTTTSHLRGCTMYCTHTPCCRCAGLIMQAGIKRIVVFPPAGEFLERWGEQLNLTRNLFAEAGVEYIELEEQ